MAKFDFSDDSITELIRTLERADLYTDEAALEILSAGAEVLVGEIKTAAERVGHRDTGSMIDHIGFQRKIKKKKDGVKYITVSVFGKDGKGVSNAVKAFVRNYGRDAKSRGGAIVGSHFWNNALLRGAAAATKASEAAAAAILRRKGLTD